MAEVECTRDAINVGVAVGDAKTSAKMVAHRAAKNPVSQYYVNDQVYVKDYAAVTKRGKISPYKTGKNV